MNRKQKPVGIWYDKINKNWRAGIFINGKRIHLGRFISRDDAIKVRQEAEIIYFGKFAPQR